MFPEIPQLRHRRRPKDTVSKKQLEMQGYTPITGISKTCQESLDVDVEDRRACGRVEIRQTPGIQAAKFALCFCEGLSFS